MSYTQTGSDRSIFTTPTGSIHGQYDVGAAKIIGQPDGSQMVVFDVAIYDNNSKTFSYQFYAQSYDASGNATGGLVTVPGTQQYTGGGFTLSATLDGRALLTFDATTASGNQVTSEILSSSGQTATTSFAAGSVSSIVKELPNTLTSTVLTGGRLVVGYEQETTTGSVKSDAYAFQIYDSSGKALGNPIVANPLSTGVVSPVFTAALTDGGFIESWYDAATKSANFARFDRNGVKVGTDLSFATSGYANPSSSLNNLYSQAVATGLATGGFAVAWNDQDGIPRMEIFDANGVATTGPIVLSIADNGGSLNGLTGLANGDIVVQTTNSYPTAIYDAEGNYIQTSGASNAGLSALSTGGFAAAQIKTFRDETGRIQDQLVETQFGLDGAVVGGSGADTLQNSGAGGQTFIGLAGNDILRGTTNADIMIGGAGDDTYYVNNINDRVIEQSDGGNDTVISSVSYTLPDYVQNMTSTGRYVGGNDLDNVITGSQNSGNQVIDGMGGNDTISGGYIVHGGAGSDVLTAQTNPVTGNHPTLYGDDGDDVLTGDGVATLIGGSGNDQYFVSGDTVVEAANGGIDSVTAAVSANHLGYALTDNVENLTLTGFSYNGGVTGTGNALDNVITDNTVANNATSYGGTLIHGGDGNDTIYGNAGNDTLFGDAGIDRLRGGDGDDYLQGGDGNDTLLGDAGNDRLQGDAGNDNISGGAGRDRMEGDAGNDRFVFADGDFSGITAATADYITDFKWGGDKDVIDLSQVDANTTLAGNQAFSFIGGAAFGHVAGQLRYDGANALVLGDTNGDGVADFAISFTNHVPTTIAAGDFIL